MNPQLTRTIEAEISRATGKRYRIAFDKLDDESLREMLRMLRDLDYDKRAAINRARREPWRGLT